MNTHRRHLLPLDYLLWLPEHGSYVQEAQQFSRRIVRAVDRSTALRLPEEQALRVARRLVRRTGQVIELRPVQPAWANQAGRPA